MSITQQQTRQDAPSIENNDALADLLYETFPTAKDQIERANEIGLQFEDSGCYRNVFGMDDIEGVEVRNPEDYVVKVEMNDSAYGNEAEISAIRNLDDRFIEECLVPIPLYDERRSMWIVMERANMGAPSIDKGEVRDKLCEYGYEYQDIKHDNLGVHDGQTKLVDYGYDWNDAEDGSRIVSV